MLECYIPPSEAVIETIVKGQTKDGLFIRGTQSWVHYNPEGVPPLNLAELHGPGQRPRRWGVDWVGNEGDNVLLHAGTYRISGWVAGDGATCKVTYENGRITEVEVEATGPGFSVALARIKSDYSSPVCLRLHFLLAGDSRDEVALDFLESGSYGSKLLFRPEMVQIRQYQPEEKGVPLGFRPLPQEVEAFAQSKLASPQAAAETPEVISLGEIRRGFEALHDRPQLSSMHFDPVAAWRAMANYGTTLRMPETPEAAEALNDSPDARGWWTPDQLRVGDEFHYFAQCDDNPVTRVVTEVNEGGVLYHRIFEDGTWDPQSMERRYGTFYTNKIVITKRASELEVHGHPGHPTPTGIDWEAAGKRGMGPEGAKMRQALYGASSSAKGYASDYSVPDVTKQGGYAEPMPSAEQVKSLALLRSIDQRLYELTMGLGPALCRKCREHAVIEQYTGPLELDEDGDVVPDELQRQISTGLRAISPQRVVELFREELKRQIAEFEQENPEPVKQYPGRATLEVAQPPEVPTHAQVTRKATGCWCSDAASGGYPCQDQQCPNAPDVLEACAADEPGAVPVIPFTVELIGFEIPDLIEAPEQLPVGSDCFPGTEEESHLHIFQATAKEEE